MGIEEKVFEFETTHQGINISQLGNTKIIFKSTFKKGYVSSQEGKPPRFSTAHFPQFSGLKACWSASASAALAACHTAERAALTKPWKNDGQSEAEICKYLNNSKVEMDHPKTKYTLNLLN